LKWTNTCVKQQGNRGTCDAFAITAAVESKAAAKYGRWLNLSEQDLYKHDKFDWSLPDFSGVYYGDGYSSPVTLIGSLLTGYKFAWERQWNYNPSYQRSEPKQPQPHYERSCVNYTDVRVGCTDTSHQSALQCSEYKIPGVGTNVCLGGHFSNWVCDAEAFGACVWGHFNGPPNWVCDKSQYVGTHDQVVRTCWYETDLPGNAGVHVAGWAPIAAGFITQPQLDEAKVLLAAKNPVVLAFGITPSFDADHNGFVSFKAGESDRGGHAVLATGYIDNAHLPAGTPPGSGGGYLIIKNSWGPFAGDGGYYYVPYDFVKTYGNELTAILDVSI
jgi:hypothetical protein